MGRYPFCGKRGFLWVTSALFLLSLAGQSVFSWFVYVDEQGTHGEPLEVAQYLNRTFKDMLENWQSEFMQLIWQVAGLAALWYVGSSPSKEGDERKERKIDLLLEKAYGKKEAERLNRQSPATSPRNSGQVWNIYLHGETVAAA